LEVATRVSGHKPGEMTVTVRVRYPDQASGLPGPDGYAGRTRIVAPGGQCLLAGLGGDVHVVGCRELMLLTRVATGVAAEDPLAAVSLVPADHDRLLAGHVKLHAAVYGDVSLDLGAAAAERALPARALLARQAAHPDCPLPALLERLFASGRYLLLSASG